MYLLQELRFTAPIPKTVLNHVHACNVSCCWSSPSNYVRSPSDCASIMVSSPPPPAPPGLVSGSDERVVIALEELQDLKGVWAELSKIWEGVEEQREKPWLSVAPRKIRQALDGLLQQLRAFPSRLKQYASYEYVQAMLKGYAKVRCSGLLSV